MQCERIEKGNALVKNSYFLKITFKILRKIHSWFPFAQMAIHSHSTINTKFLHNLKLLKNVYFLYLCFIHVK